MSTKFEQLLDYLVNEETDKANELFHEIVVEKSREIYENLIAEEEEEMDETSEQEDEAVEEATDDEEESMEESADDEEDESMEESYAEEETVESMFGEEEKEEEFPVQDQTDDFEDDTVDQDAMAAMDGEEEGDSSAPADKGDIQDLEDALEELKAEFEALMTAEKHEEEEEPGIHGEPSPLDDEEGEEEEEEGEEEKSANPFAESKIARTQGEKMREYIEKVTATMDGGLAGARTGETVPAPTEGKSPISSGSGKPTSGAKAIPAPSDKHTEDGTSPKGKVGGLTKSGGKFTGAGTHNVDGVKSGIKTVKAVAKPGNKEGAPVGSGTGDKAGQTGGVITKSPLSGAPK